MRYSKLPLRVMEELLFVSICQPRNELLTCPGYTPLLPNDATVTPNRISSMKWIDGNSISPLISFKKTVSYAIILISISF